MDDVNQTLGTFLVGGVCFVVDSRPILMQELASDINKSRRAFYYCFVGSHGD